MVAVGDRTSGVCVLVTEMVIAAVAPVSGCEDDMAGVGKVGACLEGSYQTCGRIWVSNGWKETEQRGIV